MTVEQYLKKLKILENQIKQNPELKKVYSDINPTSQIRYYTTIQKHGIHQEKQRKSDLDTALELFPDL